MISAIKFLFCKLSSHFISDVLEAPNSSMENTEFISVEFIGKIISFSAQKQKLVGDRSRN